MLRAAEDNVVIRHNARFVSFLAVMVLVGFAGGGRSLAEPPATTASADANTFDVIAKDIEKTVLRLGYPKSTADALVKMVRGWKCEQWKQNLAKARAGDSSRQAADVARVEEKTIEALYKKIGREIATGNKGGYCFYLPVVVKNRMAQCLGYSQVFYILGNSIGLKVGVINVLELVSGELPAGVGHVACMVGRSDGQVMIVDLTQRYVSRPFVFKEGFVEAGNYWQLKRHDNPLRIHPRIQVWNESGIVGCISNNLGTVYNREGHPDRAISCYNKAIELNPKYAEAFNNRGYTYNALGRNQQAISDCNKAIELNPKHAGAFYNRGTVHGRLGQNQRAISDFNKAIELNPKFAMAFYNRGNAYSRLGQLQQAISDYNKTIELNPKLAMAFYNRGTAHGKLGQHQQAISDFNKAIDLNPKLAEAYANRGLASASLGKTGDAKSDLRKARALNPALRPQIQRISDKFKLGL